LFNIKDRRDFIIVGGLILAALALSLSAYILSGHMGIEERFNNAVGLITEPEETDGSGMLGFGIEGNPVAYFITSLALVMLCTFLYTKFKI
jgi:hypothetical protein